MNYEPIIGLEVHVELNTQSKMFCRCSAAYFGHDPNTHVCPVCLGLPGALPVPNRTAIDWCVMIGLALNCKIPELSKFDRKNYFYPDLPKGYQISQYEEPFCVNGRVEISSVKDSAKQKTIRIRRVHMEEDTAKLLHATVDAEKISLIDFNRSGVPLVEIVTEPDFSNSSEVVDYLKKLQQIVRYLGVATADMEKGQMRLEPNVSLRIKNNGLPSYKVEIKNINSFRFVERAIKYEIERQKKLLEEGETPEQETRGWSEEKGVTLSQRGKEEAYDYRYFPEPDIPPIRMGRNHIHQLGNQIEELPEEKRLRFQKAYGLGVYATEILTRERSIADYFEEAVKVGRAHKVTAKQVANIIINRRVDIEKILPSHLIQEILLSGQTVSIVGKELEGVLKQVLKEHKKAVEDFKKGKESAIMFLVGQVMKKVGKGIDARTVREQLKTLLS